MRHLSELRLGPRMTVAPGDYVRVKGNGSRIYRVQRIVDGPKRVWLDIWGPVHYDRGHLRHSTYSIAPEQVASKPRPGSFRPVEVGLKLLAQQARNRKKVNA